MIIRLSKTSLVAAIALLTSLVTVGNLTDYANNFQFVRHVLLMDTIFPDASIRDRAIETPWVHHAAYGLIIACEALTALLCWVGAWQLFKARNVRAKAFNHAKGVAIAGLTLGFLVWQVGFMSIGGEWFGMWMSDQWNGVPSAFRFLVTIILVLLYLVLPDGEIEQD